MHLNENNARAVRQIEAETEGVGIAFFLVLPFVIGAFAHTINMALSWLTPG